MFREQSAPYFADDVDANPGSTTAVAFISKSSQLIIGEPKVLLHQIAQELLTVF